VNAGLSIICTIVAITLAGTHAPVSTAQDNAMNHHACGLFDVKINPLEPYNKTEGAGLARMSLDKQFHGDLEAASQGEMLSAGSAAGSGGYVAIERVSGTLRGRKGSFALMHNATMTQRVPYLNIIVVPGSGTGELTGLSGKMTITIAANGAHSYEFEYTLTDTD
jgi:hypothetical protein